MVYFDVLHPYYLPQYLPVMDELKKRQQNVGFVFYRNTEQLLVAESLVERYQLAVTWVNDHKQALAFYLTAGADWIIFGNSCDYLSQLKGVSQTALMQHGIGPKACYYEVSDSDFDVRFVEGQHRLQRLQALYPQKKFVDTGYAKLDPIIQRRESGIDLAAVGLDPRKPTLLYSPTFYPSTIENMARDWPKDFSEYNILLKPHYFSLTKPNYQKQKKLLEYWSGFNNVYLAPVAQTNLLPFMVSADVLVSDASSALFEFAALDKPVVWCDFYHLRWTYRGVFKFRFNRRMDSDLYRYADIAAHAKNYSTLKAVVDQQLQNPRSYAVARSRYTEELAGKVDGRCSQRIVDYLYPRDL
ncbi:CDP-glycerol glycerophosphotransferase family protein [Shewanella sp. A32]|uniref:CDP-glycerol glycerophosphotransferase family protein n=1 Tax=Shewanella sp. A32 TaxID=3031327 RepID=UPI0023B938DB|nr:CDP-glycerol glycerophosphotransferase family protein [Shewanella sp. A32]MDF0533492.1 CDP-glycerol glycerophosphotransferase family protein [Shewanella sp. A32]